jgi:dienelactone hydrolase
MKIAARMMTALLLAAGGLSAQAKLVKSDVEYKLGSTVMQGYMVYDDSFSGRLPGVLVVHDWMGLSDNTKGRADMLAGLGYVAFAADVYGKEVRPKDSKEASELAGIYKTDRKKYRAHLNAALRAFRSQKAVQPLKIAVMGYCFGGTGALELARSGAKLKGVLTFHGGLDSPKPKDGKNIKEPVLAMHGADDPFVPAKDVEAFENEMRQNKVDWRLIKYGNAVHSFTDKSAGTDNSKGAAYNALADARSWEDMKMFLKEIFK